MNSYPEVVAIMLSRWSDNTSGIRAKVLQAVLSKIISKELLTISDDTVSTDSGNMIKKVVDHLLSIGKTDLVVVIMRMALFELLERADVPTAVVLDEAVGLAKRFSTDDSGRFVNGVLAAIASEVRNG